MSSLYRPPTLAAVLHAGRPLTTWLDASHLLMLARDVLPDRPCRRRPGRDRLVDEDTDTMRGDAERLLAAASRTNLRDWQQYVIASLWAAEARENDEFADQLEQILPQLTVAAALRR
jgi:hypothetical protein